MKALEGSVIYFDGVAHVEVYCSREHAIIKATENGNTFKEGELQPLDLEVQWNDLFEDHSLKCDYCGSIVVDTSTITYDDQCRIASHEQGITTIVDALKLNDITNVAVEQTGGFCMVAYVVGDIPAGAPEPHPLGDWWRPRIGITWECIVLYDKEDDEEGDMLYENQNDVTGEYVNVVVEIVKTNLHRIMKSA
jgi:hypothetical protein